MYLSAPLDPSVTQAWKEGKLHTVILSADWMMKLSYRERQNGLSDGGYFL